MEGKNEKLHCGSCVKEEMAHHKEGLLKNKQPKTDRLKIKVGRRATLLAC